MVDRVKTKPVWRKHVPQKSRRAARNYYSEYKPNRHKKVIRIIWIILILLVIQGIFQAKVFKLEKFNITGTQDIAVEDIQGVIDEQLATRRFLIFKNDNYFLCKTGKIEEELISKYNLDSVEVDKQFTDVLNVTVQEKISHFIWQSDRGLYLLDASGALNRQIDAIDNKYLVIQDIRSDKPEHEQVFNEVEINIINDLYLEWQDKVGTQPTFQRIVIDDNWSSVELYTDIGWHVKLDPQEDISEQLVNLSKVLTTGNVAGQDIDYIDVRFGDKVYFK